MKKIPFLIVTMFFLFSCANRTHETTEVEFSNDLPEVSEVAVNTDEVREIRKAVINAECDYYSRYGDMPLGRLAQGQEVTIEGYYYLSGVDVDVQVKTVDGNIEGYVKSQYITRLDGVTLDLWCKDISLVRDYYYTGTVEDIFSNDYGKGLGQDRDDREVVIRLWRAFYSEKSLRISESYLIIGNDEDSDAYRLESVAKDGNTYTLYLSDYPKGEFEVVLVDNGDGITLTQCTIKNVPLRDLITDSLNFKHVPYDSNKSKKTKDAVIAWCNEQIEILTGDWY
jgi:hypothetical protein